MSTERIFLIDLLDNNIFIRIQNYLFTYFQHKSGFQKQILINNKNIIQRFNYFLGNIYFKSTQDYKSENNNFLIYSSIIFQKIPNCVIKDKEHIIHFETFLKKTESQIFELNKRIGKKNYYFDKNQFNKTYSGKLTDSPFFEQTILILIKTRIGEKNETN